MFWFVSSFLYLLGFILPDKKQLRLKTDRAKPSKAKMRKNTPFSLLAVSAIVLTNSGPTFLGGLKKQVLLKPL